MGSALGALNQPSEPLDRNWPDRRPAPQSGHRSPKPERGLRPGRAPIRRVFPDLRSKFPDAEIFFPDTARKSLFGCLGNLPSRPAETLVFLAPRCS